MFGSAARGELQQISDIDLLVVLADGDAANRQCLGVDICDAIGYEPRADVTLAFESDVRRGARDLASVLRVACEEGVVLSPRPAACLLPVTGSCSASGAICTSDGPRRRTCWRRR